MTASGRPRSHRRAGSTPMPKPSSTTRTIGRGLPAVTPRAARARAVITGTPDDAGHLIGLERRAADQRPVDRRLGQELADVRGGDAAAVQDRQSAASAPAQPVEARPDRVGHSRRVDPDAFRPVPIAQTGS